MGSYQKVNQTQLHLELKEGGKGCGRVVMVTFGDIKGDV